MKRGGQHRVRGVERAKVHTIAETLLNGVYDANARQSYNEIARRYGVSYEQVRTVRRQLLALNTGPTELAPANHFPLTLTAVGPDGRKLWERTFTRPARLTLPCRGFMPGADPIAEVMEEIERAGTVVAAMRRAAGEFAAAPLAEAPQPERPRRAKLST